MRHHGHRNEFVLAVMDKIAALPEGDQEIANLKLSLKPMLAGHRHGLKGMLVRYEIDPVRCVKCNQCQKNCLVDAISGSKTEVYHIDQHICIKCGICRSKCKSGAIRQKSLWEASVIGK